MLSPCSILFQLSLVLFFLQDAVSASTYDIAWTVPAVGSESNGLAPLHIMAGDTVKFVFGSDQPHNVWIHGNNKCEMQPTNRDQVANQQGLPGTYTFNEAGRRFFACDIGSHCEKGLNIFVTAHANEADLIAAGGTVTGGSSGESNSGGGTDGGNGNGGPDGGGDGGDGSAGSTISMIGTFAASTMVVLGFGGLL